MAETTMLVVAETEAAEGRGEVVLERVRREIEKLRDALSPVINEPSPADGLALESVEVALQVTLGGEVGILAKGKAEAQASSTVKFSKATPPAQV